MNETLYNREQEVLAQASNFFTDNWQKLVNFFTSYQWQETVFAIRVVFIIISFLLLLAIIFLLFKMIIGSMLTRPLAKKSHRSGPVFNKKKINKRWQKIDKRIKSGLEANYKLALLEADKIFDRVVKEMGYGKEKKLSNIDEIKQASKLKDTIVEDKKLKISKEEAEKSIAAYKKALEELGVL